MENIDFSDPTASALNGHVKDESHLKGTMSGDLSGLGDEDEDEEEEEVTATILFHYSTQEYIH